MSVNFNSTFARIAEMHERIERAQRPFAHIAEMHERIERAQRPFAHIAEMHERIERAQRPFARIAEMQERMERAQRPFAHIAEMYERIEKAQRPFTHIAEMYERMEKAQRPFAHIAEMYERMEKTQRPFARIAEIQEKIIRFVEKNPQDKIVEDFQEFTNSVELVNEKIDGDIQLAELQDAFENLVNSFLIFIQKSKGKISKRTVDNLLSFLYGVFFYTIGTISTQSSNNSIISKFSETNEILTEQNILLKKQNKEFKTSIESLNLLCLKIAETPSIVQDEYYKKHVVVKDCSIHKNPFTKHAVDKVVAGTIITIIDSNNKRAYVSYMPANDTLPKYGWLNKKNTLKIRLKRVRKEKLFSHS